jgi:hypothetical protein
MADLSKVASYAVTDGAINAAALSKAVGYAVTGTANSYESLSKVAAYAVIIASTATARPQVFVCT